MKTVVLKFGGTSVGSIDRIKKVCKIIAFYKKKKNRVLVVTSAMSGVTNELINKSKLIKLNMISTVLKKILQINCLNLFLEKNGQKNLSIYFFLH